jgi:hypothetical protein
MKFTLRVSEEAFNAVLAGLDALVDQSGPRRRRYLKRLSDRIFDQAVEQCDSKKKRKGKK